jgi:CHAD domain-containing protein
MTHTEQADPASEPHFAAARPTQLTMEILQPLRFHLEIGQREPLSLALYRVCLTEIDDALASLRQNLDPVAGVHEARKAMKRLRAMLRMVRDELGEDIFHAENAVLRDVARVLSRVRTAHVLCDLARSLSVELGPELSSAAGNHLIASLDALSHEESTEVLDDPQTMTHVITTLLATRSRYESWPVVDTDLTALGAPRHRIPDSFASIEPGIRRTYRRGRKGMAIARSSPTVHTFHEWRKRAKYLRYHMESLHLLWPEVIGGMAEALDTLGETLGDEHDLAELGHTIMAQPSLVPDDRGRRILLVEIARRRLDLQSVALRIGETVYHEKPRAFTARLETYWNAART